MCGEREISKKPFSYDIFLIKRAILEGGEFEKIHKYIDSPISDFNGLTIISFQKNLHKAGNFNLYKLIMN